MFLLAALALLVLLGLLLAASRARRRARLDAQAEAEASRLASEAEYDRAARLANEGVVDPRPQPDRPPTRRPLNHEGG